MDIDHYTTQRDPAPALRYTVSAPTTPSRSSAGKIRIPPPNFSTLKYPTPLHREIFGSSDDEYEDPNDPEAQRFLDSLELDPHSMSIPIPQPRKLAGTRRVVSAQTAQRLKNQAGWKAGGNPLPQPLVFQSITATPQLGGASFEELRADCYAQSFIATGARPPPSILAHVNAFGAYQQAQCIPPTFQSRIVENQDDSIAYPTDVEMADA
ncbi:hypothetical protein BDP27DRAFT_1448966 [Rhodocollybia butyracea]|uniref:Uncharacterized protein n=1 Tax=Rhodocollybia butyracea TaxID=206335 RepID=A0A9P5PTH6_9AGAR|nr:hypothetical protein BDP27DRAFT_1448966 [Rhodocollybia butyracea]